MADTDVRWEAHPWLARTIKAVAYVGPIVLSVLATLLVARLLPTPSGLPQVISWWAALTAVAITISVVLERLGRQLLPLAVMYQMSLIFPDHAPGRYKVAAKATSTRALENEIAQMRDLGQVERSDAAERILRLVAALSKHDPRTRGHAERVAVFADMIAEEIGLEPDDRDRLRWASILHDVGKIAVHPEILNKASMPSDEEWETLKTHPLEGARITAPLHDWLGEWSLCIEQHHERYDGGGYPYGLAGPDLSFGARIVGVADAYDTITAARSYKEPMPASLARQELAKHAGTQFDPEVVRAFLNISLGRLRWAMGPLSWLAQVPIVGRFATGGSAGAAGATAAIAGAAAVVGIVAVGAVPRINAAEVVNVPTPVEVVEPPVALPTPTPEPIPTSEPTPAPEPEPAPEPVPTAEVGADALEATPLPVIVPTTQPTPAPEPTPPPAPTTPPPPPDGGPAPTPAPTPAPSPTPSATPVNAPPVAVADATSAMQSDAGVTFFVLLNDTDPEDDPLTLVGAGPASSGTATGNADGSITWTPAPDSSGTVTVTYRVSDGTSTVTGFLTINVTPVNDPPSFLGGPNQTASQNAGPQTAGMWATAISPGPADEKSQVVTFLVTSNSNPALFAPGGAPAVNGTTGTLTWTPAPGAQGSATLSIVARDNGGTANGGADTSTPPATLTITVVPVNAPPTFTQNADPAISDPTVLEDAGSTSVPNWATSSPGGGADEAGQTVTYLIVGNSNTALFSAGPAISPTGTLTFTPAANANGTATITVRAQDNGTPPASSPTQTFTITVTPANDAPTFTQNADPAISDPTVLEDAGATTVPNWATSNPGGGADEAGQTVTYLIVGNSNTPLFSADPAISPTGTLTFTPAANANGTATITVRAQDNGTPPASSPTQTFTITVTPANDPPTFTQNTNSAISDPTVLEDAGATTVPNWATSSPDGGADEAGQTVTYLIVGNSNTPLFSAGPAISPTGTLTFTPAANTAGSATITVRAQDNGTPPASSPDQTFTITVTPVNDPPSFTQSAAPTVLEDAAATTVPNWATSSPGGGADEAGQTVTYLIVGNSNTPLFSAGPAISPTGTLTFTPAANANGSATITVRAQDNGTPPASSPDQTFTITVTPVNDPPTFTRGGDVLGVPACTLNLAGLLCIGPYSYDEPWATAMSVGPANESSQSLVGFTVTNDNNALFTTQPQITLDGRLTFEVFNPSPPRSAQVTVTLKDNGGAPDTSAPVTFRISVGADVNDPPTFDNAGDVIVNQNSGFVTIPAWASNMKPGPSPDEDGQSLTGFTVAPLPDTLFSSQPTVLLPSGDLQFTPATNATGSATFQVTLSDNGPTGAGDRNTSDPATLTIRVNAPPTALADAYSTGVDTPLSVGAATGVLANDTDPEGDPLTVDLLTVVDPPNGAVVVSSDGSFTYTPDPGFTGVDTFTYRATDRTGSFSDAVTVTVTVTASSAGMKVSELAWNDIYSQGDFVELYNSSSTSIDISGWQVHLFDEFNNLGGSQGQRETVTITNSGPNGAVITVIPPGGHFLVALSGMPIVGSGPGGAVADAVFFTKPKKSFGVGLWDPSASTYVDRVGNRSRPAAANIPAALAASIEGSGIVPIDKESSYEKSFERLSAGGLGNCIDTDDNSADFITNYSSMSSVTDRTVNPQSTRDTPVPCGTPKDAVPPGHLVISEIRENGPDVNNGDVDDFVEIFNPTTATISLAGIELRVGASDPAPVSLTSLGPIQPGEHLLIAGTAFAGSKDAALNTSPDGGVVLLWDTSAPVGLEVIDEVRTNASGPPGLPKMRGDVDQSYSRRSGGCKDTNFDVRDFDLIFRSTPRSRAGGSPATPCAKAPATSTAGAVVSELAWGGVNGAGGDFIELWNGGSTPVLLDGWTLNLANATTAQRVPINPGVTLNPGQYYLFGQGPTVGGVAVDQLLPTSGGVYPLADPLRPDVPFGVALTDNSGSSVDQVGNRHRPESEPKTVLPALLRQGLGLSPLDAIDPSRGYRRSYERRNGDGFGHCVNTTDNATEFFLHFTTPTPRNTTTTTPCSTPATPIAPSHLVISEFRHDGPGDEDNDFVEVFNPTSADISLVGLQLLITDDPKAPASGDSEFDFGLAPSILKPGEHFLIVGDNYPAAAPRDGVFASDGPKGKTSIVLWDPAGAGRVIDQVVMQSDLGPASLPSLGGRLEHSYARHLAGCVDATGPWPDAYTKDFEYLGISTPQTSTDAPTPCTVHAKVDSYNIPPSLSVPAPGVLSNDGPGAGPLTATLNTAPTRADVFTFNADGSFDYTPNAGFTSGSDTFTYDVTDGRGIATGVVVTIRGPP